MLELRAACGVRRGGDADRAGPYRSARASHLAALLLAGVAGCSSGGAAEVTIRDSAGVRIVESSADNAALPQWAVDTVPRVTIGVLDGEPAYQLDEVRGAVLHRDRLVIADGGSRELRVFGLDGEHIATGGRQGGGPGEFESIQWLGSFEGDSVIVYDNDNRRFSIFDLDAKFARGFTPDEGFAFIAGRFADGSFLLPPMVTFSSSDSPRNGLVRDSSRIIRVSPTGGDPDTLMVLIGAEVFLHMSERSMWVRMLPFGRGTRAAVGDSVFYTGTTDAYEISVWNRDGRLVRLLRRPIERAAVSQADIDRYRVQALAEAQGDNERRELERRLAEMPYPDRMPAHGRLHVDDDDNLWVQDYTPWSGEPTDWTVFDQEGRAIGRVRLPARFEIEQIGTDFVLGTLRDDLDVEHVVVYGLERSASREVVR